ncbi:MAG: inorganic phosphate transporter, partial [Bacteroides sp.]
ISFVHDCQTIIRDNTYDHLESSVATATTINSELSLLKCNELQRIQSKAGSIKASMIYLVIIQEAQNVANYTINLLKVSKKFQS